MKIAVKPLATHLPVLQGRNRELPFWRAGILAPECCQGKTVLNGKYYWVVCNVMACLPVSLCKTVFLKQDLNSRVL